MVRVSDYSFVCDAHVCAHCIVICVRLVRYKVQGVANAESTKRNVRSNLCISYSCFFSGPSIGSTTWEPTMKRMKTATSPSAPKPNTFSNTSTSMHESRIMTIQMHMGSQLACSFDVVNVFSFPLCSCEFYFHVVFSSIRYVLLRPPAQHHTIAIEFVRRSNIHRCTIFEFERS